MYKRGNLIRFTILFGLIYVKCQRAIVCACDLFIHEMSHNATQLMSMSKGYFGIWFHGLIKILVALSFLSFSFFNIYSIYLKLPQYKFLFRLVHRNLVKYSMILERALGEVVYSNHRSHDFHSIATTVRWQSSWHTYFSCENRRRKKKGTNENWNE